MTRTLQLFPGHATAHTRSPGARLAGLAWFCMVAVSFASGAAHAQALPVGRDGLPGGRFVSAASAPAQPASVQLGAEGAYTESVLGGSDSHYRAGGELAAAGFVRRWLALSAQFGGRYDLHRAPRDSGLATSTRLATRHGFDVSEQLSLGLGLSLDFPAADGFSRGLKSASPSAALLATRRLGQASLLSFQAGYRHDRSRHAVAAPLQLSPPDRLAAQLAKHDTLPLGVLFATSLGSLCLWAEWSWEPGLGAGAPDLFEAPMRVVAGLQAPVSEHVLLGGYVGVSPGARPDFDKLVRIEPRAWLGVTAGFVFGGPQRPVAAVPVATPDVEPELAPVQVEVAVRVTDPQGAPVAEARLSDDRGGAARALTTDANGVARLSGPAGTTQSVKVEAEGFRPLSSDLAFDPERTEQVLVLERDLPDGEIKGKVRSMRGGPLVAQIEVVEAGRSVTSAADGTFRVDVPPGAYTLRITANGHETQERSVQVEQLGVAILVIDLRRSAP